MPALETLKKNILTECAEDYMGLWSLIRDVEDCFPNTDEAILRNKVLSVLRELLSAKKLHAGFPTEGGKFRSLKTTPSKILEQIEAAWPLGHRPTIGEGLWFTRAKKTGRSLIASRKKHLQK